MKKSGFFTKTRLLQAMLVTATMLLVMAFAPSQYSVEEEWTLLKTENDISVYAKSEMCGRALMYVFKIQNNSRTNSTIKYTITIDDPSFGPATGEVTLDASAYVEGNCGDVYTLALPNHHSDKLIKTELIKVELIKK